jgi:pimeloyl-ACP methyl ester carboxylesterase
VLDHARVAVDGGELAMLRAGAGAPRALVIVAHGFPDHPPTFAPVIAALASRGLDVVAPWSRGYAPSTLTGPFHADQLGADLLAIARALAAGRPAYLVGHDWGAVATYAAVAAGEDAGEDTIAAAITLSVPHPIAFLRALRRDGQWRRSWYMGLFQLPFADRIARARDFALIDRLWRTWSPGVRLPPDARGELHRCLAESWPAPLAPYRAIIRPPGEARARMQRAKRPLTTPVRYLHGADDGCISPAATRGQDRWFRGPFSEEIIPGAGHFLHVEVPDLVAARVDDWITRHPGHGRR